jgi:hypothetical protein
VALTYSQRDAKIALAEKRLAKAELAITNVDQLKAELEWLQAAPVVPDPPVDAPRRKYTRKPKALDGTDEAPALDGTDEAPAA